MNKFIVVYEDADYIVTSMNATIEEASQYYLNNYFTFGTNEENEHKKLCVGVYEYSEFKHEVVQYCLESNILVLKFDDEMKVMYFKNIGYSLNHMCTYEDITKTMQASKGWTFGDLYGNGWDKPIFDSKEKAIQAAKDTFKSTSGRFVEVGWCILKNNQLNVVNCERINF